MIVDGFITRSFLKSLIVSVSLLLSSCDSDNQVEVYNLDDRVQKSDVGISDSHAKNKNILVFGFDLRSSPQEDARQYLPFLKYLEMETGYKFKLHFTSKNRSIVDDLGENQVQFAAVGADTFIKANEKYNVIPLVRGLNMKGKAEYQSVFVVSPSSKIKKLEDINGRHLAFGSRASTQGHLIPRIVLSKKNIKLKSFSNISYTGSHRNCADSVISQHSDVCTMQDTMAKSLEQKGLLRIIYTSNYYPSSGIATNQDVPVEVVNKVKKALLNFKPQTKNKKGLYKWERTEMPLGFTGANINDYSELRNWSIKLGFIQKINKLENSK